MFKSHAPRLVAHRLSSSMLSQKMPRHAQLAVHRRDREEKALIAFDAAHLSGDVQRYSRANVASAAAGAELDRAPSGAQWRLTAACR